jgi:hypothetical protein
MLLSALPAILTTASLSSTVLTLVLVLALIGIVFVLGRFFLHIIFQLIANSVLGLLSLFLINYFFGMAIAITVPVIIVVAIFGLPAVFIIVLLKAIFGWTI